MFETKFYKITHLKKENAILCQWREFCRGDDYRNPFRYGLELIKEYDIETWITDTSNGFENEEADTKWLLEEFMPEVIESSVKSIVFVMREDSPLRDEIEGQVEALSEFFEVKVIEKM